MSLLSFTPMSSHLLPVSAVRRHQPPLSTTLFPPPLSNLGLKQTTTTDSVRFLCSPLGPLGLCQRVPRFVVPRGLAATTEDLLYNAGATVAVLGGAYALAFAFDDLTRRKILHQDSNSTAARYFAAFVPLVNCLRLLVNGLSLASDEGLVKSVTSEGDPRELLRGPLYYVLMLMLCALVFWHESSTGVISLGMMCGGDADIIGRRYGSMKFPYNQKKSWADSISKLAFGFLVSTGIVATTSATRHPSLTPSALENHHWMVLMEKPPQGVNSKPQVIDYYVQTLKRVMGSEEDAQMCLYDASWATHFGFCCDIDEEIASQLASLPGVLLVRPDPDFNSLKKDYSLSSGQAGQTNMLFPTRNSKHWLVRMDKPGVGVVTKAQIVDYYAQILTKVMGNEKDAQMCIYHVAWKTNFGFCCELDEDCAKELAGVPGVLSVQPDKNFESENKDYEGSNLENCLNVPNSFEASQATPLKTKKLFVTGLSFYTSEKTLRAAFEGFGELVEVKVIMDKISKRSKGYAFVEYTTEEAASAALKEMNGKIINGWMIVVDVAKPNPPRYNRGRAKSSP